MRNHGTTPILEDIYEPTIPGSEGQVDEPEEEKVLQPQQRHHAQRQKGYFDLHPDRRLHT